MNCPHCSDKFEPPIEVPNLLPAVCANCEKIFFIDHGTTRPVRNEGEYNALMLSPIWPTLEKIQQDVKRYNYAKRRIVAARNN